MAEAVCPWCGCGLKTVGEGLGAPLPKGHFEWKCGSFQHGRNPHQVVSCELNVELMENQQLQAEIERLQAIVDNLPGWANELVDAHNQLHGIPCTRMGAKSIACVEKKMRKATAEAAEAARGE